MDWSSILNLIVSGTAVVTLVVATVTLRYTRSALSEQRTALNQQRIAFHQQLVVDKNTMWVSTVQWALSIVNDPVSSAHYKKLAMDILKGYVADVPSPSEGVSNDQYVQHFANQISLYVITDFDYRESLLEQSEVEVNDSQKKILSEDNENSRTVGNKDILEGSEDCNDNGNERPKDQPDPGRT